MYRSTIFQHRGAVASISIASTDLLLHVGPLPMEQLILHDTPTVCGWPNSARGELFAVARRDIAVARRNLASMTQYVDLQDDHLAACEGGLDDGIPLMTVETFPRPASGIRSQPTEVGPTTEDGMVDTPSESLDFFSDRAES